MHSTTINKSYRLLFLICFVSSAIGGTVSTLMSVYLPMVVRDLKLPDAELSTISAYINALFIAGWAIGGFSWGLISDRIGRKRPCCSPSPAMDWQPSQPVIRQAGREYLLRDS